MSNNELRSRFDEKVLPFLKSIGIVLALSPWLLYSYWAIIGQTAKLEPNDRAVLRDFIEWFGTAYSFFLALAIVNVWSQFETVERELDRELDAVSAMLYTVRYIQTSGQWQEEVLE